MSPAQCQVRANAARINAERCLDPQMRETFRAIMQHWLWMADSLERQERVRVRLAATAVKPAAVYELDA